MPLSDNAASAALGADEPSDPRDGVLVCPKIRWEKPWRAIDRAPKLDPERSRLAELLAGAGLLLWNARVRREGSEYVWQLEVAPESLVSPVIEYTAYKKHGLLWHPSFAPDYLATEARYREALANGADGYEQQFRIDYRGRTVWLDETVRITRRSESEWDFSGLVRDITRQKTAEESERQARREADRLLQHAQCALWHATVKAESDGRHVWSVRMIPSGLQRSVFERNDDRDSHFYSGFDVPQLEEMDARARQAILDGAPGYQQEFAITRRRDHQTFWIREHVAITRIGEGEWSLSGVMIDITERKVAELARQDSELHLARLLDQVDCIVWHGELVSQPGGDWRWRLSAPPSRLYRRLFRREPHSPTLQLLWTPELTPEFPEMEHKWRRAIAENAGGYEQEFRHLVEGGEVWLHESVSILHRTPTVIHLAGVIIDITARKHAEIALKAEKERLAVMLREMDEAVVTVDLDERVTFLNEAAERVLRIPAATALGRELDTIAPLQLGQPPQPIRWPHAPTAPTATAVGVELIRADGPAVRVEGCVAPLHDAAGQAGGAIIVFRDVTERHLLQMQLQRATTLESVGVLAGGIAHDFNNILTALLANLSLAEMEAGAGSEVEAYLREAHAATDRAAALARQLLTFAKGGEPLLGAVDVPEAIQEVTRFTLRGTPVEAVFQLASDLWPVRADAGQFGQIIQNLVLNAAQSMPSGGTITIAAANETLPAGHRCGLPAGRFVRLTVSDTGSGIAPEAMDRIFTPYFTTKSGGNGLGLAVVYSIVTRHHGAIDVQSAIGGGTTFEIRLPAAGAAPTAKTPESRRTRLQLHGRVLLMDDEMAILRVMATYLRDLGLRVETALDGGAAVAAYSDALAAGDRFDVVVMDLTVPGKMGGREAIAALRQLDPNVRAIVASGYSNDPVLANYKSFGFAAVATKPFDIVRLGDEIARLLEPRHAS